MRDYRIRWVKWMFELEPRKTRNSLSIILLPDNIHQHFYLPIYLLSIKHRNKEYSQLELAVRVDRVVHDCTQKSSSFFANLPTFLVCWRLVSSNQRFAIELANYSSLSPTKKWYSPAYILKKSVSFANANSTLFVLCKLLSQWRRWSETKKSKQLIMIRIRCEKIRVYTHHRRRDLIIGNLSWSCQGEKKVRSDKSSTTSRLVAPKKRRWWWDTIVWRCGASVVCSPWSRPCEKNEKWNYIERKLNKYQPDLAPKSFPSSIVDGRRRRRRRTPLTAQKNYLAPYLSTGFPSAFLVYSSVDFVCCRFFPSMFDVVIPSKTCA